MTETTAHANKKHATQNRRTHRSQHLDKTSPEILVAKSNDENVFRSRQENLSQYMNQARLSETQNLDGDMF